MTLEELQTRLNTATAAVRESGVHRIKDAPPLGMIVILYEVSEVPGDLVFQIAATGNDSKDVMTEVMRQTAIRWISGGQCG